MSQGTVKAEPVETDPAVETTPTRNLVTMSTSWVVIDEAKTAPVVVELVPAKGWHIYWLNPGDSGLATSIELKQNQRWLTSRVRMPVPKRKVSAGDIVSFAFDGPTRFFVAAEALTNTASVTVTAGWLACADVCIKGSKTLELAALKSDQKKPVTSIITEQRQDWDALPIERTLAWNKSQQQLVFEGPVGALGPQPPQWAITGNAAWALTPRVRIKAGRMNRTIVMVCSPLKYQFGTLYSKSKF